jgi:hypothetical protein
VKEQLPVVRTPEYKCTITYRNVNVNVKKLLPIVRAPECERTFTYRKSSRI